jgi:hypothetical protein
MTTLEAIRAIIAEKEARNIRPLNTHLLEVCERSGRSEKEVRQDLNQLFIDRKIAISNGVNHLLIELI